MYQLLSDFLSNKIGSSVLLGILFIIGSSLYRAYRSRLHGKEYKIESSSGDVIFETALGTSVFKKNESLLEIIYKNNKRMEVPLSEIKYVKIIQGEINALFDEVLFERVTLTDILHNEYNDQLRVCTVAVVTNSFVRYPLFVVSQHQVRDIFSPSSQPSDFEVDFYVKEVCRELKSALSKDFKSLEIL